MEDKPAPDFEEPIVKEKPEPKPSNVADILGEKTI